VVGVLADIRALLVVQSAGIELALDPRQIVVDQHGGNVLIALASTVPYQNDVTGAFTAPGLIAIRYEDHG
jgi:hypothetical protein